MKADETAVRDLLLQVWPKDDQAVYVQMRGLALRFNVSAGQAARIAQFMLQEVSITLCDAGESGKRVT